MTLSSNALRIGRPLSGILLRCGGVGAVRHRLVVVEVLSQLVDLDLQVVATTNDHTVFDAVQFLRANRQRTGEYVPDHLNGEPVDLSFASAAWTTIIRDRRRLSSLVRRHFEVCVFSYLAAELRAGDIAVVESESCANLHEQPPDHSATATTQF